MSNDLMSNQYLNSELWLLHSSALGHVLDLTMSFTLLTVSLYALQVSPKGPVSEECFFV